MVDFRRSLPRWGKTLPAAVYAAWRSLDPNEPCRVEVSSLIERHGLTGTNFDVVKWHQDSSCISLLRYPDFLNTPHPTLQRSTTIDPVTGTVRVQEFEERENPPILHRCEELLPPSHPLQAKLRRLTRLEERYGLYADTSRIGTLRHWQALLLDRQLQADGFDLVLPPDAGRPVGKPVADWPFDRNRTAIRRPGLSVPVRELLAAGLLSEGNTFFDYGCGQGIDVECLKASGWQACGWDPCHRPAAPKTEADVVHLGYVLNVIEDQDERVAVVRDALQLSRKVLSVAVRVRTTTAAPTGEPWGDGEVTRVGTFQHYFHPDDFAKWLEEVLGVPALNLAPGVAVAAREPAVIHEAIARRVRRPVPVVRVRPAPIRERPDAPHRSSPRGPPSRRLGPKQRRVEELLDAVASELVDFGRTPRPEEWAPPASANELGLGVAAIWRRFVSRVGAESIHAIATQRQRDILVFLAMSHFVRLPAPSELSVRLRNDIQLFLGSYRTALTNARALLFEAGRPESISLLCDEAGVGVCDEDSLHFHGDLLSRLHPVLRIYVGCAEVLGAQSATADIIKIHKRTRKVSFLEYQGFSERPLPALVRRIKVDLRSRTLALYDHSSQPRQLLYNKHLYVGPEHPALGEWQGQSRELQTVVGEVRGRGPDHLALRTVLTAAGADPDLWVPADFPPPEADDRDDDQPSALPASEIDQDAPLAPESASPSAS